MPAAIPSAPRRNRFLVQDFAWVLFVAILLMTAPEPNYNASILLPLIGAFQIIEPRLKSFSSKRGQIISLALKLVLSYLLVGWSHTIFSYYYQIFLIPVVSAATTFELGTVILVTLLSGLAYFSFLLPVFFDYTRFELPPDQVSIMSLRVAFFAIVAFLVYEQARAKRLEMQRTQEAAEQLREAQDSLRRTERLAALGQLTAGLAHELRNPLGTIKASAEMLLKESMRDRPEVRTEMAEYIGSEVNRINNLIGSFLNFAKPLTIRPVDADLSAVVDDVVWRQEELAKQRQAQLIVEKAARPCRLSFDPELMTVALSNLVQNALQASAPGQQVRVELVDTPRHVTVTVRDQGHGIAKQNLESIFNPFFTTKPQGVGLGLPIVAKIIDEHLGRIRVESEEGHGALFEIVLNRTS